MQTAKADVQAAKEALRVAQLNLRDAFVRAPMAGVVQTRTVETGQYLSAGERPGDAPAARSAAPEVQVTEADAPRLTVGMSVNMALRETARTYAAKITLVAGSADPTSHLVADHGRRSTTRSTSTGFGPGCSAT